MLNSVLYKDRVFQYMPRGQLTKDQIKCDVLKIKRELNNEIDSDEEKLLAHKYLDKILAKVEEYRY